MKLKDKIIVVTGGAGLLGRIFSEAIANEGGIAIIADIDLNKASEFSKTVRNAEAAHLDITSKESIESLIAYLMKKYGRVDALINNAYPRNKQYGRNFLDVEYSDFCENMNLNLGGYFLASQRFIHHFLKQGSGNIINIASIYGVIPPRFEVYEGTKMTMPVEYAAIKSGLIHLTKYMAKFSAKKNIRVNTISPGGLLDAQPEAFLKRYKEFCLNKGMLNPKDLVGSLIFLLSNDSEFINGQNLIVDDGFTL